MIGIADELPKWKQRIINIIKPYLKGWGLLTLEDHEITVEKRVSSALRYSQAQRENIRNEYECELSALNRYLDGLFSVRMDRRPYGCNNILTYTVAVDDRLFMGCNPGDTKMNDYTANLIYRAAKALVDRGVRDHQRPFVY